MLPLIWSASSVNFPARLRMRPRQPSGWESHASTIANIDRHCSPINRCRQGSPRYPDALYGRGWVYYQGSDWPKAAPEFEQVVQRFPEASIRPGSAVSSGRIQFNLKDFEKAIAMYQQLLREYPPGVIGPQCALAQRLGVAIRLATVARRFANCPTWSAITPTADSCRSPLLAWHGLSEHETARRSPRPVRENSWPSGRRRRWGASHAAFG